MATPLGQELRDQSIPSTHCPTPDNVGRNSGVGGEFLA
jgi:hypothetical protein